MPVQKVIWTVNPNLFKDANTLRISLLASPRLIIDAGEEKGRLSDFPAFVHWPDTVKTLSFTVELENIEGGTEQVIKDSLDPDKWNLLFKPETLVRSYKFDDYSDYGINNTFSMKNISEKIKEKYVHCALKYDKLKPSVRHYGFTNDEKVTTIQGNSVTFNVARLGLRSNEDLTVEIVDGPKHGEVKIVHKDGGEKDNEIKCIYTPSKDFIGQDFFIYKLVNPQGQFDNATVNIQVLSNIGHSNIQPSWDVTSNWNDENLRLNEILSSPDEERTIEEKIHEESTKNTLLDDVDSSHHPREDFYKLKNFHRMLANNSNGGPTPGIYDEPTELDFHQVVSRLSQYPLLTRKMGLVVDIEYQLPSTFVSRGLVNMEGKLRVTVSQPPETESSLIIKSISLWTAYYINKDADLHQFFAKPDSDGYIKDGMLDVSKVDDFDVHVDDLDSDGEKLYNFASSLKGIALLGGSQDEECGLPALRTSNMTFHHKKRTDVLKKRISRSSDLEEAIFDDQIISSTVLTSTDLLRGFRVDIWDSFSKEWHSLCWRQGNYKLGSYTLQDGPLPLMLDDNNTDEGFLSLAASKDKKNKSLFLSESLISWDGWGLCVRQPGNTVGPDSTASVPQNQANDDFPLEVIFSTVPNTLPLLRFGGKYRFRLRAVDLAGNSLAPNSEISSSFYFPPISTNPSMYLRAEPVSSPTMVKYREIDTPGESIDTLVIRDYEWEDDNGGQDYMSQRHIAPPKVSQRMAELHGMFDEAFKKEQNEKLIINIYKQILDKDYDIPDLDSEDSMHICYLPDPIAQGVTFYGLPGKTGSENNLNICQIPFSDLEERCQEPFYLIQENRWPERIPFRLKLAGGNKVPHWETRDANTLTVYLPKSEIVEIEMSCYISEEALEKMLLWKWMVEKDSKKALSLKNDIIKGRHWMFTPFKKVKLVHAVKKPLLSPEFQDTDSQRQLGDSSVDIFGRIMVHGKSTERITITGKWDEKSYLNLGGNNSTNEQKDYSFQHVIDLSTEDTIKSFTFVHHFMDTKYRRLTLTASGISRFRDYYPDTVKDMSVESTKPWDIDILNSSRPLIPIIKYIIPVFRWNVVDYAQINNLRTVNEVYDTKKTDNIELQQDIETKKKSRYGSNRRGNSLRIYLEAPWYTSGDGELMGVVLWSCTPPPNASAKNFEIPDTIAPYVTQWGQDPIFSTLSLPSQSVPILESFSMATNLKTQLSLAELESYGNKKEVAVDCAGYSVQYDEKLHCLYCDVDIDAGDTYFPFIRLSLSRYQPKSVPDAHLSPVVLADYIQMAPNRSATVVFDPVLSQEVNLIIAGPSPQSESPTGINISKNIMEVTLEIKAKTRNTDLWIPINDEAKILKSQTDYDRLHIWKDKIELPRPRNTRDFRLIVKEYEVFFTAPDGGGKKIRKLVYVDVLYL